MLMESPILLPQFPNLLSNPRGGELHPLLLNKTLFLAAWLVSNNQSRQREFQIGLPSLSSHLVDQTQIPFTTQLCISGIADAVTWKFIHISPLWLDINKVHCGFYSHPRCVPCQRIIPNRYLSLFEPNQYNHVP